MTEKTGPEVLDLKGLADYQSGSVVSKTLINKKTGPVTLFAFDEGQGLSEHVIVAGVLALGAVVVLLALGTHLWGHPTTSLAVPD